MDLRQPVVIAEDDASQRRLLMEALTLRGFAVVAVPDSDSLYDLLVADHACGGAIGAVIADLRTPGTSLERSMRWVRRHYRGMPMVLVTGDARIRESWVREYRIPVIPKPIRLDRLVRLMLHRSK
ncbi:MAG: hypothetical protein WBG86_17080 [Polyangiales bacterium]